MKNSLSFFTYGLMLCLFALATACSPVNSYTYESIKDEYAHSLAKQQATASDQKANTSSQASSLSRQPLTLKKAIKQAIQANPKREMALARIRRARAATSEAKSAFWPRLSAYSQYTQGDAPSAYLFKTIDQRQLPPNTNFNDPGWFENFESGIKANLNLFKGGRDALRLDMAQKDLHISTLSKQEVDNQLQATVIKAYYSALAAKDSMHIAQKSVDTVRKELEMTRVRYEAGGVLKSDLLSMQVRLAQSKEDLVRAKNNYQRSLATLANVLGLDADKDFKLSQPEALELNLPSNYRQRLGYALAHRAELEKIRQKLIKTRLQLDMVRSEYLPRLDLQGKYYHDDPDLDYSSSRENWTLGLMLNWEFFSGLSTQAKEEQAQASIQEMLAADRKTVQAIQLDVKTSSLRLEEARARRRVTQASVRQAEESLKLVRLQYKGGSSTITRYLNAELALTQARMAASRAYYDQRKARSDLARALGYWSTHLNSQNQHLN